LAPAVDLLYKLPDFNPAQTIRVSGTSFFLNNKKK